jgi:L-2-hydroxyglutarate oxidase LhgO
MNSVYDFVIIGSGIAGLYSAYKILHISPNSTILMLERNKKSWLGGRTNNIDFYGSNIVTGAGIGRQTKDKLLISLLDDLKIPHPKYSVTKAYGVGVTRSDITKIISYLKTVYNKNTNLYRGKTFRDFAIHILRETVYNNFVTATGYTDYENADIHDVLYYYGMDDNSSKLEAFYVPWKKLVDDMIKWLLYYNVTIKSSSNVTKINRLDDCKESCGFVVSCVQLFCVESI